MFMPVVSVSFFMVLRVMVLCVMVLCVPVVPLAANILVLGV
jgi:hypothetical protein